MKKRFFMKSEKTGFKVLLYFPILLILSAAAYADVSNVNLTQVGAGSFYPGEANRLVLQVSITDNGTGDVLTGLEISNVGTADAPGDISAVKVWYQAGGGAFNAGTAQLGGVLPQTSARTWGSSSLSVPVVNGSSLYVTVDISSAPVNNSTTRISVARNAMVFVSGNRHPTSTRTNASSQTIVNPEKLYVYFDNTAGSAIVKGQASAAFMDIKFRNSSSTTGVTVDSITLFAINHAGTIPANAAFSGLRARNVSGTQLGHAAAGGVAQVTIPLSPAFTVPAGGGEAILKISADISGAANTFDAGLRLASPIGIVTAGSNTTEAYSGYAFPMNSGLSEIKDAVNSVNATFINTAPGTAVKGQQGIGVMRIIISHPHSVTTYSSVRVNGLTLTASSIPSLGINQYLSALRIFAGSVEYARNTALPAGNDVVLNLSQELIIPPGGSAALDLRADSLSGALNDSFSIAVTEGNRINCTDATGGMQSSVFAAFPFSSSQILLQQPASGVSLSHVSKMPQYAVRGQKRIYCADLIFTHPDSGNHSAVEAVGITLTVENEIGAGVVPSLVLAEVLITDSTGNTLAFASDMPVSGSRIFMDFQSPLVIPAGLSRAAKVYMSVKPAPSEGHIRLGINSSSAVRCVDANSKQQISVQAALGAVFPMKTSAVQFVDPAIEVHGHMYNTLQPSLNQGQAGAALAGIYFINPASGIAAVDSINIGIFDAAGASLNASEYISSVIVERASNTGVVYASAAVLTTGAYMEMPFSQLLTLNPGAANAVSVTVRAVLKQTAPLGFFRIGFNNYFATAVDFVSGLTISAHKKPDGVLFESGLCLVQARAQEIAVFRAPSNAGTASKGDASFHFMSLGFRNTAGAGSSAVTVRGITLTVEAGTSTVSASSLLSRIYADNGSNTAQVFGERGQPFSGHLVYIHLGTPFSVAAGESVTVNVRGDISVSAPVGLYRINLKSAAAVSAVDFNERRDVTVTASPGQAFPDMASDYVSIVSSDRLTVSGAGISPVKASTLQKNTGLLRLDFGNASDAPVSIRGVTLNVRAGGAAVAPADLFTNIYAVDHTGNTLLSVAAAGFTGNGVLPLVFFQLLSIPPSQAGNISIYADLKQQIANTVFDVSVDAAGRVDALPATLNVQAAAGFAFPLVSSGTLVQLAATAGGVYHTDVIPTTVSTGQTGIFAKILSVANINPPGSAAITLSGLTLTVENDANVIIAPNRALKRVMIRDDARVYAFTSAVPSSVTPFFVAFSEPLTIEAGAEIDLKVYVDIIDTLSSGTFRASISIGGDIRLTDGNTGLAVNAQAINGDSFPMKTSTVIIQQKAYACHVSHESLSPPSVNRGQAGVLMMKAVFENQGGPSGANEIVTRINVFTENMAGAALIPSDALSAVYIKDASGAVYGSISSVPDYGDMISIGLTTPVTLRPGLPVEVFIYCDIEVSAPAEGFKLLFKAGSNITVRDANSYEIILAQAKSGSVFPMKTAGTLIQQRSGALQISGTSLLNATVNKGDTMVPALLFEIINPNPAGHSGALVEGFTISVDSGFGAGLVPSSVLSGLYLSADNGPAYAAAPSIPTAGDSVYLPVVPAAFVGAGGSIKVTVYADISPVTGELYMRLGLKQASAVICSDANQNIPITQIIPRAGASFPMNSGVAVINSTPGLQVDQFAASNHFITAGQKALAAGYRFYNIGSFAESVEGLTLTVVDAGYYIESIVVLDDGGNIIMSRAVGSGEGPEIYLGFEARPLVIQPQDYNELHIYAVYRKVTYQAAVTYSLNAAGVNTAVPVSAASGNAFPMQSALVLQAESGGLELSFTDIMPPAVSTGQADIYSMAIRVKNSSPAGTAAVSLHSLAVSFLDGLGNTISAAGAVSAMRVNAASGTIAAANAGAGSIITAVFEPPLALAPGESRELYIAVDATGNSAPAVPAFAVSVGEYSFSAVDKNSGNTLPVRAAQAFSFPFESSAALIQKAAKTLKVTAYNLMPSFISTSQENIPALMLVLEGGGGASDAGIMVTRMNLHALNASAAAVASSACVRRARITTAAGVPAGEAAASSSSKITINLSSPVIVPAGQAVTVYARYDALSSAPSFSFVLSLETQTDIYAVDANSFKPVSGINAALPLRSSAVSYQNAAQYVAAGFDAGLAPAVTRGTAGVEVFRIRLANTAVAGSAAIEIKGITLNAYGVSGQPIQAVSALSALVAENESGLAVGAAVPGFSEMLYVQFSTPLTVNPGAEITLRVKAGISGSAYAEGFSLSVASAGSLGIYDVNSGVRPGFTGKNFPWNSGVAYIYDTPAQQLYAWHDGTSFAPGQAGRGQKNIKFLSLSLLNPGSAGTSSAFARGVTVYVIDGAGNTIAPSEIFDFIKISDLTGIYYYGGVTASALAGAGPAYVDFTPDYAAPASRTVTVYFSGDISERAKITSFRLLINSGAGISAYDVINGDIPVASYPGAVSFPMQTSLTSVIATANILTVKHKPLMPASVEKGRMKLDMMELRFAGETQFDIAVEGITLTVKDKSGNLRPADSVLTRVYVYDAAGNTIYGFADAGGEPGVYVPLSGLNVPPYRAAEIKISADISPGASGSFFAEFIGAESLKTGTAVLLQAAADDYFGNMKSGIASIQEADFELSFRVYPSPYNPENGPAVISYYLEEDSKVTIRLFTPEGRPVFTVCEARIASAGLQSSDKWDGRNSSSVKVRSGVYICVIEAEPLSGAPKKIIRKPLGVLR